MLRPRPLVRADRRGSALVLALVAVALLASLTSALLGLSGVRAREVDAAGEGLRALHRAESGISDALVALVRHARDGEPVPETLGGPQAPLAWGSGEHWVEVQPEDAVFRIRSHARVGRTRRSVEAVAVPIGFDLYSTAVFAGNRSADPSYVLRLTGSGVQADEVEGDVYSGGDVLLEADAAVSGNIHAVGTIHGGTGEEGARVQLPDIAGMDYPNRHDYDVAALFAGQQVWRSDEAGGSAWQVPEANPAHIFRKNPSDRTSETGGTQKDDYFLEDPYEPLRVDAAQDGSDASRITLSGTMGRPGPTGTDRLYYVDGNLWLHNKRAYSFKLTDADNGARVTFVVKGNIYFSDNLFLADQERDGVAFIAIADEDVADSGNIYFGDPEFGTLREMHAFMYAENDFFDYNLDAVGSARVKVVGNMTAGNHVSIERDFADQHSKLRVELDGRIANGDLTLPGLPRWQDGPEVPYALVAWREVAVPPSAP